MPPRDWLHRIDDIRESLELILTFAQGQSLAGLRADRMRCDAILRNLEIMGEAARHVPDEVVSKYPEIPWQQMRGLRNVLAHEYHGVDVAVVWQLIEKRLPELKRMLDEGFGA
ncbi:MAG: DUF86 domain-containing protein [Alphaproteobacteria bacterium]|nr:DUF86 domain-containing protein [Alphaproteobacteria bacterium]